MAFFDCQSGGTTEISGYKSVSLSNNRFTATVDSVYVIHGNPNTITFTNGEILTRIGGYASGNLFFVKATGKTIVCNNVTTIDGIAELVFD